MRRHDWPWRRLLGKDGFTDGNFSRNPAWQVAEGRFSVTPSCVLVSEVTRTSAEDSQERSSRERAMAIFGALLSEAAGLKGRGLPSRQAEIYLPLGIPGSFAMEARSALSPGTAGWSWGCIRVAVVVLATAWP